MAKNQELNEMIRTVKFKKNLKQSEIAEKMGVKPTYLSDAINGRVPFSASMKEKIYEVFSDCFPHTDTPVNAISVSASEIQHSQQASGNGITQTMSNSQDFTLALGEISEMRKIIQEQVKNSQEQFDRFMSVIEQLTNKIK